MGSTESATDNLTLPRPPTPPREKAIIDTPQIGSRRPVSEALKEAHPNLNTPPSTHSVLSGSGSRAAAAKRVGFSGRTQYFTNDDVSRKKTTPLSASSTLPPPAKSILKKNPNSPLSANPLDPSAGSDNPSTDINIPEMLESTVKQLAGGDRESKIDAYRSLHESFRGSNNLPDRIALQDKMTLFTQFIQRDLTLGASTGTLDSQLSIHTLNVLSTFLHYPAIASTLPHDFSAFLVDHCIHAFEGPEKPTYTKDIIRRLMYTLVLQDFPPKVMTAERIGRLVSSLHGIEANWTGKGILHTRILTYRKLLGQSKQHMISHSDWLEDLFGDMMSSVKDIRQAAIDLGLEAAYATIKDRQLSSKVQKLLGSSHEEQTYQEYYIDCLLARVREKGDMSCAVPQIWGVVLLLLHLPNDKWKDFQMWLRVMQSCFNSSNMPTRQHANVAWSRLAFASHFEPRSFSKQLQTLVHPLNTQLSRKPGPKALEDVRRVVFGALCMLFYYALKPGTAPDHAWKVAVVPSLEQMIANKAVPEGLDQASRVLASLLDISTQRIWKEDLNMEIPIAQPDHLPALDPKWIRRNSPSIFSLVGPIVKRSFTDLSNESSLTSTLWKNLVTAVASVASMEIKVATDTATFVAEAFTLISSIWTAGPTGMTKEGEPLSPEEFLSNVSAFVGLLTRSLGNLTFTEKLFAINKSKVFTPVANPSSTRHGGKHANPVTRTPLHHLFVILSALPPGLPDGEAYATFIQSTLKPFFDAKKPRARPGLAYELFQLLPMDGDCPYGIWALAVDNIIAVSQNSQLSHPSTNSEVPTGNEYRDLVKLLSRGLRSSPNLPWSLWQSSFEAVSDQISEEAGQAGRALGLVEPLAKLLSPDSAPNQKTVTPTTNVVKAAGRLLAVSTQPRDPQAVDAARRRLWGTVAGSRSRSFDPFESLYILVNHALQASYDNLDDFDVDDVVIPLLSEVTLFLSRCNDSLAAKTVLSLQEGLVCWVRDEESRLSSRTDSCLAETVKGLWDRLCSLLSALELVKLFQRDAIEPLLVAAFESRHRHVVNTMAMLWNRTFDQEEHLECSEGLRSTLLALRSHVDIILPGLDLSSLESGAGQMPSFVESQDDLIALEVSEPKPSVNSTPRAAASSPLPVILTAPPPSSSARNTPSRCRDTPKHGSTARARHDDSQIHFTTIPSSSPGQDSQMLTERQREVRDRQRNTSGLLNELHPSPERGMEIEPSLPKPIPEDPIVDDPTMTPDRRGRRYVSSTPTPRRPQDITMMDLDNDNDPPSSPPEPRRLLLANMSTRSQSSMNVMEEWPLSSSPVHGSPSPSDRGTSPVLGSQDNTADIPDDQISNHELDPSSSQDDPLVVDADTPMADADMASEDDEPTPKASRQDVIPATAPTSEGVVEATTAKTLLTDKNTHDAFPSPQPSQMVTRSSQRLASSQSNNVIDLASKETSFEMSDVDETALERLAVEAESRTSKNGPSPMKRTMETRASASKHRIVIELPAYKEEASQEPEDALRSSQVSQTSSRRRGRPRKNKSAPVPTPTVIPSTPASARSAGTSQKRKRSATQVEGKEEAPGSKRRRSARHSQPQEMPEPDSVERRGLFSAGKKFWQGITGALADLSQTTTSDQMSSSDQEGGSLSEGEHGGLEIEGSPEVEVEDGGVEGVIETTPTRENGKGEEKAVMAEEEKDEDSEDDVTSQAQLEQQLRGDGPEMGGHIPDAEDTDESSEEPEAEGAAAKVVEEKELEEELTKAQKIMKLLSGGLVELRGAALTRGEVYEIESMFMDVKRELYEAERRGREDGV